MSLHGIWMALVLRYTDNQNLADDTWAKLSGLYQESSRYYHNLNHIQALYDQLQPFKDRFDDFDSILFALFFHDCIYDVSRRDNEEMSALEAEAFLSQIGYPRAGLSLCAEAIRATQTHTFSDRHDVNLFLDADLSVLGAVADVYDAYAEAIRKEYSIYPDELYIPGRKQVLEKFLAAERIFKTQEFRDLYENHAHENIRRELA